MSKYKVGDIIALRREYESGAFYFHIYAILSTSKVKEETWHKVLYVSGGDRWTGTFKEFREKFIIGKAKEANVLDNDLGFLAVYGSPLTIVQNLLNTEMQIGLDEQERRARKELENCQATIDAVADFKQKILE